MRSAICIALLLILSGLAACGGPISSRAVREQIASLGDARLATDDVVVERVITEAGDRIVAEATLQTAFLFERNTDGEWKIVSVRIGDDEWIDLALFQAALVDQQVAQTRARLRMLASGVTAFEAANNALPQETSADPLPDILHPRFVPELVRQDAWGSAFRYELSGDTFRLSSPGPDRQPGTPDDIEVSSNDAVAGDPR